MLIRRSVNSLEINAPKKNSEIKNLKMELTKQ